MFRAKVSKYNPTRYYTDTRWQETDPATGMPLQNVVNVTKPKSTGVTNEPVMIFRAFPDFDEQGREIPWYVEDPEYGEIITDWIVTFSAALWVGVERKISLWLEEDFMDPTDRARHLSPYAVLMDFLRPMKRDPYNKPTGFKDEWLHLFYNPLTKDKQQYQIPNILQIGVVRGAVIQDHQGLHLSERGGKLVPECLVSAQPIHVIELPQSAAQAITGNLYDLSQTIASSLEDPVGLDHGVFFVLKRSSNRYEVATRSKLTHPSRLIVSAQLSEYRPVVAKKTPAWGRILRFLSYQEQAAKLYEVLPADLLDMAFSDYPDYRSVGKSARPRTAVQVPTQPQAKTPTASKSLIVDLVDETEKEQVTEAVQESPERPEDRDKEQATGTEVPAGIKHQLLEQMKSLIEEYQKQGIDLTDLGS